MLYGSADPYPGKIAELVDEGVYRGHSIATLAIYPVQYKPVDGEISYYQSVSIQLQHESTPKADSQIPAFDANTQRILEYTVENSLFIDEPADGTTSGETTATQGSIPVSSRYVVVTSQALAPAFSRFVEWKRRTGVSIEVVTIESIYAAYAGDLVSGIYDDAGKLRQFLKEAYNDGHGIKYALLAGRHNIVPIRLGTNKHPDIGENHIIPTDLYFADFDGNWDSNGNGLYGEQDDDVDFYPEIYVGRLLVQSAQEVENWTNKLIQYENYPGNGDFGYLTRAFLTQADQLQEGNQAYDIKSRLTWCDDVKIFEEENLWDTLETPNFPKGKDVIDEFNTHYGLASFLAHGGPRNVAVATRGMNKCKKYKVTSMDSYNTYCEIPEEGNGFDNMTNSTHPTIYYSISCETMPIDDNASERNMGEVYTSISLGGGPAYIGNTRNGYVTSSNRLFREYINVITSGLSYEIGIAEAISKTRRNNTFYNRYLKFSHNLLGCPETELWTAAPQRKYMDIDYSRRSVRVVDESDSPLSDVLVVFVDGHQRHEAITDQHGLASCPFAISPYSQISATKHNYLPSYTYVLTEDETWTSQDQVRGNVVVPEGVTLTFSSAIEIPKYTRIMVEEEGVLRVTGGSLHMKSQSGISLAEEAKLFIVSNSTLNIDDCAELEILPGAQLMVQSGNTLRIAPDAILKAHDGHGSFNIHRNAIIPPGFVHPEEVVPPVYRITTTGQVWSNRNYSMHLDLVVELGAKLTLNHTTLRFSENAGIRIKRGAELETNYGELTRQEGSCAPHELWKGIVVEGNALIAQNYRNQGGLRLDKTTVSYASTGVEVKSGGIAKITRSTFHNNLTGVAFRAYRSNSNDGSGTQNMSYVDYSTFTHDADILLPHLKPSVVYIDLNGVTGIDIAGNTFENLAPNAGALNSRGYGIKALNADVKLENGNTFKNLFMGIQASATMGVPGFTVSDQTFENCFNGVRVSAYSVPVIQNSQFLVPFYNGSEGMPTAISIVNLNSFLVEGNSILGGYSGYGIYLENQLPCSGNVVGNSLEKLSVGISAEGSLMQGNMGANTVQVLCNQFNDNAVSDILVQGEGLAGIQGTPEVSASNQFGRSVMHLISEDVPLVYYGYPQSGYLPTEVNARVRVLESDELSDCSSRLMAGFGGVELTGVALAQNDMVEVEQFMEEVQDMGNTQDVIGTIEELAHTDPLGLRNELLNRSPMLSDTVMVRSSSDETDLPHIMLAQVLMANPQSTKSHAVVTALEEKANPLPYYLMDAIQAEGSTLSPLDILRSTASSHRATRDYVAGALTHRFVSDTLGKAYESIQLIGDYHPSIMYQYLSAFAAYESAGSEDALLLLNQMASNGELTPIQQQELQGVISFITLLDTAGEELFDAESEEYAELVSIATGENGLASILADNLISYLETTPFFAEEYMEERSGTAAIPPLYGPYVEVSPYPVSQYVIISYGMGEVSYDVPLLRITDRAGKELHAQELTYPQFEVLVEVDHWKPGLYTVSLLDGQSILAENTFVIEGVEHFDDDHKDKDDTAYPMISVYPNPTPGAIRIAVSGTPDASFTYDIYNSLGTSLTKGRGVGEKEVDLSRFGKGSYMIVVGANDQRYTLSVMVK